VSVAAEYDPSLNSSYYELKQPITQIHFYCEIIRGMHERRPAVAETTTLREYRSEQANFDKAFECYLMEQGFESTKKFSSGLSLVKLHRLLQRPPAEHTDLTRARVIRIAKLVRSNLAFGQFSLDTLMTIPNESALFHKTDDRTARMFLFALAKGHDHLLECKNSSWRNFLSRHLGDIAMLSRETSRNLTALFNFLNWTKLPLRLRAEKQVNALFTHWQALVIRRDDKELGELLNTMIDTVINPQVVAPKNITNVHDIRLVGKVAKTAASLVKAYQSAGWLPNIITSDSGHSVIEPINPALIDEHLTRYKAELQAKAIANAEILRSKQVGRPTNAPPLTLQEAERALGKLFEHVKKTARTIAQTESLLAIEKKSGQYPERVRDLEAQLRRLCSSFNQYNAFTKPFGALQYLDSKHIDSAPKQFAQSDLPCLSIKQMLGMTFCLPRLGETIDWCDGLDSLAKRTEGVDDGLLDALNDSHIAYLGTQYEDNDSCWDGGASRLMLMVRNMVAFELLPESGDFSEEFFNIVKSQLTYLGSTDFRNSDDDDDIDLKTRIIIQLTADKSAHEEGYITEGIYNLIEKRVEKAIYDCFPDMLSPKVIDQGKAMITEYAQYLCEKELPDAFKLGFAQEMTNTPKA
jgi:hypothetical protein